MSDKRRRLLMAQGLGTYTCTCGEVLYLKDAYNGDCYDSCGGTKMIHCSNCDADICLTCGNEYYPDDGGDCSCGGYLEEYDTCPECKDTRMICSDCGAVSCGCGYDVT